MSRQQDSADPNAFYPSPLDPASELASSSNSEVGGNRPNLRNNTGQGVRSNVDSLDYPLARGYSSRPQNPGSETHFLQPLPSPFDYRSAVHRSNSPFPPPSGHSHQPRSPSISSHPSHTYPYLHPTHTFSQAAMQSGRSDTLPSGGTGGYGGGYNAGLNQSLPYNLSQPPFGSLSPVGRSAYQSSPLSGPSQVIQSPLTGYAPQRMQSAFSPYEATPSTRRPSNPPFSPSFDPSMPSLPLSSPTDHLWQTGFQGPPIGYNSSMEGPSTLRLNTNVSQLAPQPSPSAPHPVWPRPSAGSEGSPSFSSFPSASLRVTNDAVTSPSPIDSRDTGSPASSSSSSSVTFVPFQPGQPEASLLAHKITEDKSLPEETLNELFPPSSQWQPPVSANNKPVGKKWICQWPGCKKPVRRQDRMAHALEHNGRKRFQCSCGHAFARTQDKRRHLREQATCRTCLRPVGRNGVDGVCSACLAEQAKKKS